MADKTKRIQFLVADTTAFINAVQLSDYAENVLTVPDVVEEVRNKRQIRRLCVLPFDLVVREPRSDIVRKCVEFSKKTGDYASLSGIDIKVIALTYELEADNVGTDHLRSEPVLSKIVASKDKPEEFRDSTKLAGWYNPNEEESDASEEENHSEMATSQSVGPQDAETLEHEIDETELNKVEEAHLDNLFENLKCADDEDDHICDILIPVSKEEQSDSKEVSGKDEIDSEDENISNQLHTADEDDGWITPSNIKNLKKSLQGTVDQNEVPLVACMSTDFAIQNVLKQMNLNVSALDGRVIKHLRTYILRCYTCFRTTSIMTKVFCPSCGNKTLKRVAVSLDENGKQVIHINTRRPLTTKYKNQSLPRFCGGKHSHNPILFEDQPIPRQMPSRIAKTKTKPMDEDYMSGFSPFAMRDVDSKSAMLRSKGNLKEWARNNTFEEDRRRKHYNRLYK